MIDRTLNRRELIGLLGAAAIPAICRADTSLVSVKLVEHVAFTVPNIDQAMVFYRRLFGNDVVRDNKSLRRYLRIGPCYLEISQAAKGEASRITRFGASVENFQAASLKSSLKQAGVPAKESAMGLIVTDPDGAQFEFGPVESWQFIRDTTAEPGSGTPLFQAKGMDHVAILSADMQKSTGFYRKLFGMEYAMQGNPPAPRFRAGETRVGLYVPTANKTGLDHYSVLVNKFDVPTALRELKSLGAKADLNPDGKLAEFYAPDGIRMQVSIPA
jgi:catechol 2,3-dioxygenase-like lactoylglutathione lyase family enzyme